MSRSPRDGRIDEFYLKNVTRPEDSSMLENAPVRGHGLWFTILKA